MKKTGAKKETTGKKRGRVKISKLGVSKETLKDLTTGTKRQVRGGGFMGGSGGGFSCAVRPKG